jgi:hypothetical protein
MAADPQSFRRRAVYAALMGSMDEGSIMQVLAQLPQSLRSDQATDVIRFVDGLSGPFGLDGGQCKRLYADIYKRMREPESALPPDPMPQASMPRFAPPPPAYPAPAYPSQAYAPQGYMPAPQGYGAMPPGYGPNGQPYMPQPGYGAPMGAPMGMPEVAPMVNPVAAALAAAAAMPPAVQPAAAAPVAAPAPVDLSSLPVEPQMIFGAVMRRAVGEVAEFHAEALDELRKDALAAMDASRLPAHAREAFRDAWSRPRQANWQITATQGDLAELTRITYVALVDVFGRAGADQILQRSLQLADALPEARQFSPRRLLAAM